MCIQELHLFVDLQVLGEEDVEGTEALRELSEGGAVLRLEGDALVHQGLQHRRAVFPHEPHVGLAPRAHRVHYGRRIFQFNKWDLRLFLCA